MKARESDMWGEISNKQLREYDQLLGSGRFGDVDYLSTNIAILYNGLSEIIASKTGTKLNYEEGMALARRIVVRRCIDESFASLADGELETALNRCRVFADLAIGSTTVIHDVVGPLTFFRSNAGDRYADSIADAFQASMRQDGVDLEVEQLCPHQRVMVIDAVETLAELLPCSAPGSFLLAPGVILFTGPIQSAYINDNPCAFHINVSCFKDVMTLAEALFHEALHQKAADVRLTTSLLVEGYDNLTSEGNGDVLVPWPSCDNPRKWSFARALAAHHVYVHLSVFYARGHVLARGKTYRGVAAEILSQRLIIAFERARYLDWALRQPSASRHWGEDVEELIELLALPIIGLESVVNDSGKLGAAAKDWRASFREAEQRATLS